MNKQHIMLALLAVCLVATGVSIRTFNFTKINLGGLTILTALSPSTDCFGSFENAQEETEP